MEFSIANIIKIIFIYCLFPVAIFANDYLALKVKNQSGDPVEYVVISAYLQNSIESRPAPPNKIKVIDQVDKEFIDHVLPIQLGTSVSFPNHDQIRHHVYSFSQTKKFEIPLYEGVPINPIFFDKTGVVSLGCNIHDWMSAYIYVVDTPYFTITDTKGKASLALPFGDYKIRYWHPDIDRKSAENHQIITFDTELDKVLLVHLEIKKSWSFRRGPLSINNPGRYR